MVTIDWSSVGGFLLLLFGAIGTAIAAWKHLSAIQTTVGDSITEIAAPVVAPKDDGKRGADLAAPPGAVEWVLDLCEAMSAAGPGTILDALRIGESRDAARARRIAELEVMLPNTQSSIMKVQDE